MTTPIRLPSGLTARRTTRADAGRIFELVAACELEADGVVEVDLDDIAVGYERSAFDPAADTLLVLDGDETVAWAEVYRQRADADVRPSHRGRGIGAAVLRWTEDRARELGDPAVGQSKTDANVGAKALFVANGYEPAWTSWILRIALDGSLPAFQTSGGISIRTYELTDAAAVHGLVDAAFSEWPGREPEPFEMWAAQSIAHGAFAPEVSLLAFDGSELVGVALAYDYPDLGEGWIQELATKATHRRRGISKALLRMAFATFRERGRRVAGLSTDSRTGALGLYESVGMHVERQYTRYRRELEAGARTDRSGG